MGGRLNSFYQNDRTLSLPFKISAQQMTNGLQPTGTTGEITCNQFKMEAVKSFARAWK